MIKYTIGMPNISIHEHILNGFGKSILPNKNRQNNNNLTYFQLASSNILWNLLFQNSIISRYIVSFLFSFPWKLKLKTHILNVPSKIHQKKTHEIVSFFPLDEFNLSHWNLTLSKHFKCVKWIHYTHVHVYYLSG